MPLEKGRRSSILKPSKVRNPLGELDQLRPTDRNEDDAVTETTRNRRVSFSHKKGVALFTSEEGNTIWHNIYEEHNKPDLSDSGGGSHLHISIDETSPENPQDQQSKFNTTLANFQTDDDEEEHCVDIQAMLMGIKKPPVKEMPNIIFETTQPSMSDQTDILINYQIPHEVVGESQIIKEEPEIHGDILFNESGAEMSITQDIPVVILSNEINTINKVKKPSFELVEDEWSQDKENIVLKECLEHYHDNVEIKEEILIKNESIHIDDVEFATSNLYRDDLKKDIMPEDDLSFSKAIDNNILEAQDQDCEMSMTYCFTKEVKMNNKRETIGYNMKKTDISLGCTDNEEFDPLAEIKTERNNRISEVCDNYEEKRNFEFVECDKVNSSLNLDELNTSDALKDKLNDSLQEKVDNKNVAESTRKTIVFENDLGDMSMTNAIPGKIFNDENVNKENVCLPKDVTHKINPLFHEDQIDCNMSMTDIVSAMKQSLDDGKCEEKMPETVKMKLTEVDKENMFCAEKISNKRKTIIFDTDDTSANMSMTSVIPQTNKHSSVPDHNMPQAKCSNRRTMYFDQENSDCDMSMTNIFTTKSGKADEKTGTKRKTIVFDPEMPDSNISMTCVLPLRCEKEPVQLNDKENKHRTIMFDPNTSDCNMSMTAVLPSVAKTNQGNFCNDVTMKTVEYRNKTVPSNKENYVDDISVTNIVHQKCKEEKQSEIVDGRGLNENKNEKRKTILFDKGMPEFDMSMTNVIPLKGNEEKRKTIIFDKGMPDFDMSMTNVNPIHNTKPKYEEKRKTIIFNQDMPDCDMSMTGIIPVDDDKNKRKTINFNQDMPDCDMSMTGIIPVDDDKNKRKTINFNQDMPDCDMSMTGIIPVDDYKNKRKTINFNQDMPGCDMSMTGIIPVDENKKVTKQFNQIMSDCDFSITGIVPLNSLSYYENELNSTTHFDMSVTKVIPSKEDQKECESKIKVSTVQTPMGATDIKKSIESQKDEPVYDTSIADVPIKSCHEDVENPSKKSTHPIEDMPKCDTSKNQFLKPLFKEIPRKSIHFGEMPNCDMSKTDSILLINKDTRKNMHSDHSEPDISMTFSSKSECVNKEKNELANQSLRIVTQERIQPCQDLEFLTTNSNKLAVEVTENCKPKLIDGNIKSISNDESTGRKNENLKQTSPNEFHNSTDKYFEQACKGLYNNTRLADLSCMSMSGMAPRVPSNVNYDMTLNNISTHVPNIDESKSILFDNNMAENRMMEISKCFQGYRDPCKSANNSFLNADKSINMSLPNIEDSGIGDALMVGNLTNDSPGLNFEQKINISNRINVANSESEEILSPDNKIVCRLNVTDVSFGNLMLPQIGDVSSVKMMQREIIDDFHMSVDEVNMDCDDPNDQITEKQTEFIEDKVQIIDTKISPNIDESLRNEFKNINKDIANVANELVNKSNKQNAIVGSPDLIDSTDLKFEKIDNRTSENIVDNFTNFKKPVSDVNVHEMKMSVDGCCKKGSEKRKSENITHADASNYSLPKKQKIVIPEVCLWVKDVSVNKSAIERSNATLPKIDEIDSQTYTICRDQLEDFTKIKKLNDDVHDQLNGSDHYIENVNLSLVDSSLDKSGGSHSKNTSVIDNVDAGEKNSESFCESLRTSTDTTDSPLRVPDKSCLIEKKPVIKPLEKILKSSIEDCLTELDSCDVIFGIRDVVFLLMNRQIRLSVIMETDNIETCDLTTRISDILLEHKPISRTDEKSTLQSVAAKMALVELDVNSLKSACIVGADITEMVEKCCQVTDKAWSWVRECYRLYVKYNLKLVDDRKWTFEICDGFHLCVWEFEIRLHNRRILHHAKPENIRVRTASGKSSISDSSFTQVIENTTPGWTFIPHLISSLHELIKGSRFR